MLPAFSSVGCHAKGVAAPAAVPEGMQLLTATLAGSDRGGEDSLTLSARMACTSKCKSENLPGYGWIYHPPGRGCIWCLVILMEQWVIPALFGDLFTV